MSRFAVRLRRAAVTAPPGPSTWPDETNTGPTVALTALPLSYTGDKWHSDGSGNVFIDQSGAIISGYDIPGSVNSNATSRTFTLSQCRVRGINELDWFVIMAPGSTISDCEIGGGADGVTFSPAIGVYASGTIERVNSHHSAHGFRLDGSATIRDSYLHDYPMEDWVYDPRRTPSLNNDYHSDPIMITRGTGGIIQHNTISHGNTALIFVQRDITDNTAIVGSLLIDNNQCIANVRNGQMATYAIWIQDMQPGTNGPFTVTANVITGTCQNGPLGLEPSNLTHSGNTFNGTPLD